MIRVFDAGCYKAEIGIWRIRFQNQTHGIPEDKVISDIMLSKAAIKKMVPAENIGAIVKFLCSDAADSITGIALPIDSGRS